ncbi:MAG: discoidin domain-containing protein [Opitutales bacterium]
MKIKRQTITSNRVICLISLTLGLCCNLAAWRSELYPADWQAPDVTQSFETEKLIQDFSTVGYRNGEEIPEITGPVYDITQAPYNADNTGSSDATAAIQQAIDDAEIAGGGVVYLPAGTYRVQPQGDSDYSLKIDQSGVVLRGAGVDQTFIYNTSAEMRKKSVVRIEGSSEASMYYDTDNSAPISVSITQDLMGPTSVIPVSDTSEFNIGDSVVVRADVTDDWVTEHDETDWIGFGQQLKGFAYGRIITDIDHANSTLTLNSPTRYYLKTRDNARVFKQPQDPINECGIEDLSMGMKESALTGWEESDYQIEDTGAYDAHAAYLITITRAINCWVRRVESYQPADNTLTVHTLSGGIELEDSRDLTLSDLHFKHPQYRGGGGNGYMFRIQTNECLIKGSSATSARHGFVFALMISSGNVIHNSTEIGEGNNSDHHMHFSHSNLVDTCTGDNTFFEARYRPFGSEPNHNLTSAHSIFWNLEGLNGRRKQKIVWTEQSRYGYAIGTRGKRTTVDVGDNPKTLPLDHVEGEGLGDTLEPFSLYLDQVERRRLITTGTPYTPLPERAELSAFENSIRLTPLEMKIGGQNAQAEDFAAQWSFLTGPTAPTISNPTSLSTDVLFSRPGVYTFSLESTALSSGLNDTFYTEVVVSGIRPINDNPISVEASESQEPNLPELTLDGDFNTRWSAEGDQWIQYNLGIPHIVEAVAIAFLSGDQRDSYLSIELSLDGSTWTTIFDGTSPVRTLELQTFDASDTEARYVRINGTGNSTNAWNSYAEVNIVLSNPVLTFNEWLELYPSLDPDERSGLSDPDGDNSANLAEYFFKGDPQVLETQSPLTYSLGPEGFELRFDVNEQISEEAFMVIETSEDLHLWEMVPNVSIAQEKIFPDTLNVVATIPLPSHSNNSFYRLRISE